MTDPHPNVIANNPPVLRCDNEPCLFHHLGICQFHCHQWLPIKYRATHTRALAATFSEEECEYLEELILDNIEQYPDSGSFTPEKRDALYQKIAFKMQAGDGDE